MHVYLADFSLTRILTSAGTVNTTTSTGKGTPGFQSPELLDSNKISTAGDIFSPGCVLIELITARHVREDLTPVQILYKLCVHKEVPRTDDVRPSTILDVIKKCTFGPIGTCQGT